MTPIDPSVIPPEMTIRLGICAFVALCLVVMALSAYFGEE